MKEFLHRLRHGWLRDSETLALGWLQAIVGFAGTAWEFLSAVLALVDWTQLVSLAQLGFSRGQLAALFGILFAQGVITVWLRKRRDPELQ